MHACYETIVAQVLVVDDDADVRVSLAHALRREGHAPLISASGRVGLDLARSAAPDLLILDLLLPDIPGATLIEALRRDQRTEKLPFLVISARSAEADRVAGLELGAEDYVIKPFSMKELMLRVKVVLRRSSAAGGAQGGVLSSGALTIDPLQRRVAIGGRELSLTPIELKLLTTLVARSDRPHSREALLSEVWGLQPHLMTRTIDVHVRRLREKLGEAGDQLQTVRGVGYRWRPPSTPKGESG